ncbi:MAG: LPXTG cell wall anchor domain-containing protein, partial [Oscillospiraceae bacterium]|nr:LPXTG cell wall anchor domain-containing protein [Oscillospiraceae bacterium]
EPEPGKAAPPAGFPKTGDDTRIALWIGLLCIAAGGVIATLLISRKKKNGETEGQPDEKE